MTAPLEVGSKEYVEAYIAGPLDEAERLLAIDAQHARLRVEQRASPSRVIPLPGRVSQAGYRDFIGALQRSAWGGRTRCAASASATSTR